MNIFSSIFLPLSPKQLGIAVLGFGYALYKYSTGTEHAPAIAGIIALITFALIVTTRPQRDSIGTSQTPTSKEKEEILKKFQMKVAKVQSQIAERKARGQGDDPKLNAALKNLEELQTKLESASTR